MAPCPAYLSRGTTVAVCPARMMTLLSDSFMKKRHVEARSLHPAYCMPSIRRHRGRAGVGDRY